MLDKLFSFTSSAKELVDNLHTSDEEKAKIREKLDAAENEALKVRQSVVLSETKGAWYQRLWRPAYMYVFLFILCIRYGYMEVDSYLTGREITMDIPVHLWGLIKLGFGGYMVLRSGEKFVDKGVVGKLKDMLGGN